jgi:hypothetical protein
MDYAQIYPCIALAPRGRIGQWWIHKEYKTYRVVTKYYYPENPRTPEQQGQRQLLANGVQYWQGFTDATKNFYNQMPRPRHMSGYNRYLRMYLLATEPPISYGDYVLQETGDKLLQESGSGLLLDLVFLLTENSENLVQEDSGKIIVS